MMMTMYNPYQDIKVQWIESATYWGKVAIVCFYVVAYAMIVVNVLALINPAKFEWYYCPINQQGQVGGKEEEEEVSPVPVAYSTAILREWELFIVAFFCYALKFGLTVGNVLWVSVVFAGSGAILARFARLNTDPTFDCTSAYAPYGWILFGLLVVALICQAVDDRKKATLGSHEERQALNA